MKKLLLSMVFAIIAMCAGATTTTISYSDLVNVPGETEVNGYTVNVQKENGQSKPQIYSNALRTYAKNSITISGGKMTKIVFTLNESGAKRIADLIPSTGKIDPAQTEGCTTITWVGEASSITFTVGDIAVYGTESTKAGQLHFDNFVIEGEVGGVVEPIEPEVPEDKGYYIEASELSVDKATNVKGFTFDIQKGEGSTAPAYNAGTSAIRLYAKNTMTISAEKLTKITITLATDGAFRYTTVTPSTGKIEPAQAAGDKEFTWVGDAESVTFTIGDKATLGTDGESKAGQIRFYSVTIEGTPGEGGSTTDPEEPAVKNLYLGEDDANGLEGWTINDGTLPEGLTYIWSWKAYNNKYYLNASAYKDAANASDAWAISPVIDLNGATAPKFSFDHAARFQTTLRELCYVAVREEGATEWKKLDMPVWPEAGVWTFMNSGEISLASYVGKKIEIGFHYGSTAEGADTWEIKNLKLEGLAQGGTVEPEPTPDFVEFKLATTIESGKKYVLAADGKVATTIKGNYGYLLMADATIEGDICKTEEANAFTINANGDKYTIVADGKYYYMTGTFNSFNVSETMPETGALWTISVAADGKATITNVEMNKTISYSANFTSFGSYAEIGENALPTLYVLNENASAVESVVADENAPVEYFNLQGIRVANPENGIFIRRQGNKVSKVIIR